MFHFLQLASSTTAQPTDGGLIPVTELVFIGAEAVPAASAVGGIDFASEIRHATFTIATEEIPSLVGRLMEAYVEGTAKVAEAALRTAGQHHRSRVDETGAAQRYRQDGTLAADYGTPPPAASGDEAGPQDDAARFGVPQDAPQALRELVNRIAGMPGVDLKVRGFENEAELRAFRKQAGGIEVASFRVSPEGDLVPGTVEEMDGTPGEGVQMPPEAAGGGVPTAEPLEPVTGAESVPEAADEDDTMGPVVAAPDVEVSADASPDEELAARPDLLAPPPADDNADEDMG